MQFYNWFRLHQTLKRILFSHAQLQNLDFVNLSAIFLPLFLQFPSVNFFKIWQLDKTSFQFDDERFKFTNQELQYFLTMKTTYFNITEKLARSPPPFFLSPDEIVAIKFTCTQNIETLHRGNLKKILIMIKKKIKKKRAKDTSF